MSFAKSLATTISLLFLRLHAKWSVSLQVLAVLAAASVVFEKPDLQLISTHLAYCQHRRPQRAVHIHSPFMP